jgi:stearoyl-CoA desaturase (delta-9 desaturase)
MKLSHNQSVRLLQILNHLLIVIGLYFAFSTEAYSYLLISILCYWTIGILGINVSLHRLLTHRSFETSTLIEKTLSIISVVATVGSPIAWVAVHRHHHKSADTIADVHSPHHIGIMNAWLGFWNYSGIELRLVKDLRKDTWQKLCHKNYFYIIFLYCLVLALIDPWLVIFAYAIPVTLCLHSSSIVNILGHMHGYRTFNTKDKSTNSWIASIFSMGDGWHNNHHADPRAWSNWKKWWEVDVASMVIKVIKT